MNKKKLVVYASIRFTPISRQAQQARALACPYTQTVFCGCASSRADKNISQSKNLLSPLQPENYFHLSSFMALFPQIWRQYMC
ncbi:hypothetical protein L2E82_19903 [Cichorium intybus]|uniref:Uncharacterized protein n=1 Tax=Cichorium intybus TaxID=13427 RepID=A0ACB9DS56_CICIN|nr:hypothetical protein L2E82_19903 [Cichorium intybus]